MALRGPYDSQPLKGRPETLGERLRAARIRKGLTQFEAAESLRTEQTTVSSWERDKVRPSGAALVGLALFYGLSVEALETGEGFTPFTSQDVAELPKEADDDTESEVKLTLPATGGQGIMTMDLRKKTQKGVEPYEAMGILMNAVNEGRPVWIVMG